MYFNKAIIIGNLTRDPELRAMPTGGQVCSFSVATNRVWKDKEGNKKEQADFHNVVVFGRQAETCGQYLKKGQTAMIEGRIQTRSWDDKTSGEKKYRTEIVADRVQFGPKAGGGGGNYQKADAPVGKGEAKGATPVDTIEYPQEEINVEDIPF